jgi:hypothetical protein
MERKNKTKCVFVGEKTFKQLEWLCKITNSKKSMLLSEVIDHLLLIGANFKSANISYVVSVLDNGLVIHFDKRDAVKIGSIPLKTNAKEVKKI